MNKVIIELAGVGNKAEANGITTAVVAQGMYMLGGDGDVFGLDKLPPKSWSWRGEKNDRLLLDPGEGGELKLEILNDVGTYDVVVTATKLVVTQTAELELIGVFGPRTEGEK